MNHQKNNKASTPSEIPNIHWADHVAEELIAKHPDKAEFVCASGISPSGVVHIGNFREVITVDLVVRALRDRGKPVRFIYSWDDFDALRKVPANLPEQESLTLHLREPISLIPDPFGDCESYAAHFEKLFESELKQLGIEPQYIYQNQRYRQGRYNDGIRKALEKEKEIVAILNRWKTEALADDWTCVSIFCKECKKDLARQIRFEAPSRFHYSCTHCKRDYSIDMDREGGVKLLWRIDWPMRWAQEGVDFEPGGKDHSSQGGSYDTGAEIVRTVYGKEPPQYLQYDFVLAKGLGAKLSSSSGRLITLTEALEIYEPQVIRWIFASRKPNIDFSIAFDLDVMKAYDDFDRTERIATQQEASDERRYQYDKRIYELSVVAKDEFVAASTAAQFPFRHLCNILQIHEGNIEKAKNYFSHSIKTPFDDKRFQARATRAWKWITSYAPEEFRFQLRSDTPPAAKHKEAIAALVQLLEKLDAPTASSEEQLASNIYEIIKSRHLEPKPFFQDVYSILISKPNGPKLASFFLIIGPKRAAELLKQALK
ncbi:MAG: lysine--tRNA ligase [Deltaproteobacteria bacterium]|nr:lysine--tRNA ligase [Deltaproteobacteria bacterium]